MAAVPICMRRRDWLLVQLGEKNVCNRAMDTLRSTFQQVRESHQQLAFAQSDRRIQGRKAPEADIKRGNGRSRTKLAVLRLKDRCQGRDQTIPSINPSTSTG